jgi:hypothetical protein
MPHYAHILPYDLSQRPQFDSIRNENTLFPPTSHLHRALNRRVGWQKFSQEQSTSQRQRQHRHLPINLLLRFEKFYVNSMKTYSSSIHACHTATVQFFYILRRSLGYQLIQQFNYIHLRLCFPTLNQCANQAMIRR